MMPNVDMVFVAQPYYRLHGSHNNRLHLGLHYMAESMKRGGASVCVYNGDYEEGNEYADWVSVAANEWNWERAQREGDAMFDDVAARVAELSPRIVFIAAGEMVVPTLNNGSIAGAQLIARHVRKLMGGRVRVVGVGPQFSFGDKPPEEFDNVIRGEGDGLTGVGGLSRVAHRDMDALPMLEADTMDPRTPVPSHDMDYVLGSRGCAYSCSYCLAPQLLGKTRVMSPARYVAEMRNRYDRYGVRGLYFCDLTFAESKPRVHEICRLIREHMPDLEWWAEARVETLSEDLLVDMARSGCKSLKIGVESGDPGMLAAYGKTFSPELARDRVRMVRQSGIAPTVYVLLGAPNTTRDQYVRSLEYMKGLDAAYFCVSVTTAARGTLMHERVKSDLATEGLYVGGEEGFGHLSDRMKRFWGIDEDVFDEFMKLVDGSKKEDAGFRKYVRRLL